MVHLNRMVLLCPAVPLAVVPKGAAVGADQAILHDLAASPFLLFFVSYFDASLFNPELHDPRSQLSYWVNLGRGIFGFTAGWIAYASFEAGWGLRVLHKILYIDLVGHHFHPLPEILRTRQPAGAGVLLSARGACCDVSRLDHVALIGIIVAALSRCYFVLHLYDAHYRYCLVRRRISHS